MLVNSVTRVGSMDLLSKNSFEYFEQSSTINQSSIMNNVYSYDTTYKQIHFFVLVQLVDCSVVFL
jgi:hypothetical protein